jgi:hypothetical protein
VLLLLQLLNQREQCDSWAVGVGGSVPLLLMNYYVQY